jgi:hypothetical protein
MSPTQILYLHTGQHKQNKHIQTSILRVGFEPTISVFGREKAVHIFDRSATAVGLKRIYSPSLAWSGMHYITRNSDSSLPGYTVSHPRSKQVGSSLPGKRRVLQSTMLNSRYEKVFMKQVLKENLITSLLTVRFWNHDNYLINSH